MTDITKEFVVIQGRLFWNGKQFTYLREDAVIFQSRYAAKQARNRWIVDHPIKYGLPEIVQLKEKKG